MSVNNVYKLQTKKNKITHLKVIGQAGGERRKLIITGIKDNVDLLFPITPFPKFSSEMEIQTIDLFGHGEKDVGATPKLTRVSMTGIFPHPDNHYDFALDYKMPKYYINWLYYWMNNQSNLKMRYCTDSQNVSSLNCRVTKFDFAEEDGTRNVKFNLSLKEYKENKLTQSSMEVESEKVRESYGADTYYVGEGDTLISIAAKLYGDSSKWDYLMNKNDLKNPLDLTIGQGLKI